jgi:hypothetical protein
MKRGDLVRWLFDKGTWLPVSEDPQPSDRYVMGVILQTHGDPDYNVGPPYLENISLEHRYLVGWFIPHGAIKKLNMNPNHLEMLHEAG